MSVPARRLTSTRPEHAWEARNASCAEGGGAREHGAVDPVEALQGGSSDGGALLWRSVGGDGQKLVNGDGRVVSR